MTLHYEDSKIIIEVVILSLLFLYLYFLYSIIFYYQLIVYTKKVIPYYIIMNNNLYLNIQTYGIPNRCPAASTSATTRGIGLAELLARYTL